MSEYDVRRVERDGDLSDAYAVRQDVFVEEQNVSADEEWDGNDDDATHVVAYDGDYPVGTARLRTPEDGLAKIERVAVREPYRGRGIGRLLMDALEADAREQSCSQALLHAQTAVEPFYQKRGYERTSGVFEEANIPHVKMRKPLD
ncbi:Predicted N-acyltransferase, GNAT family [Halovenus aranensis]|jgi:predicted GNAT family N-acyltransferase|uniref:Predicted N-acyltransferase, GNAT family n=1 Tax=Halovenus aranensis TaxID=890420 RepID=A0A1G8S289_9EURY|nr:GNAT family N-acetyltransferase [Halovenus aranensis]SDJ23357.1 Predicted N-acyltransferase, GNAT family [Halovenus aranensis]